MPDEKRQHLNLKLDTEATVLWDAMMARAQKSLGFVLSQGQLVGLALKALEEKFAAEDAPKKGSR